MRIVMYTPTVPMEAGGVQAVFHQVSDGLAAAGHDVRRVWPVPFADSPRPAMDDYVPDLDRPEPPARRPTMRESVWKARRLWAVLGRGRPQVVNVHFVRPGCRHFLRWRRWLGFKVVLTFHGSDALRTLDHDMPHLRSLIRRADAVTAVSPRVAQRLVELRGDADTPIHTILNGIDWDYWSAETSAARRDDTPIILAVGRLFEVKNHRLLVSAMARLRDGHPQARLVILGGGHCEAELRQQIAELGLEAVVELPGQADREQVRSWLGRASVYVLPSLSEGMPLSLLEAMAAGVPCVATAVGGVPHLVEGESPERWPTAAASLVASEDPGAMASAIARILDDPRWAQTLRERGRVRASQLTQRRTVAAYEALFASLL